MRCESAGGFEDCISCAADCGECDLNTCAEGLTCTFGCIDFGGGGGGGIPRFSLTCLSACIASTCPDSRFFLDQVTSCAINAAIGAGCRDLACIMDECRSEIAACFGDRC
jgi:hypothetical protein